jgi:hypothetical protein
MDRAALLERYRGMYAGENNTGFGPLDLIHKFGSPLTALLYSELFCPEFIECEGMVFLAAQVEDDSDRKRVVEVLNKHGGNRSLAERSLNVVEIPALFGKRAEETSDEEDMVLAERVAVMWRARLAQQFPSRRFEVAVLAPTADGDELSVSFYEVRA